MRPIIIVCSIILALFGTTSFRAHEISNSSITVEEDTLIRDEFYLDIRGRVLEFKGQQKQEDKPGLADARVWVTNEAGIKVIDGICDSKGRLAFKLPLNRRFMMHISKDGYVEKMVIVDTHVPLDCRKTYQFTFDIDIFEKINGLDVSVLEKPIARISFKPFDKKFVYDKEHTSKVNTKLQKMYSDYYALKRKEKKAADTALKAPKTKQATKK
jgi:hypothetical protein